MISCGLTSELRLGQVMSISLPAGASEGVQLLLGRHWTSAMAGIVGHPTHRGQERSGQARLGEGMRSQVQ